MKYLLILPIYLIIFWPNWIKFFTNLIYINPSLKVLFQHNTQIPTKRYHEKKYSTIRVFCFLLSRLVFLNIRSKSVKEKFCQSDTKHSLIESEKQGCDFHTTTKIRQIKICRFSFFGKPKMLLFLGIYY